MQAERSAIMSGKLGPAYVKDHRMQSISDRCCLQTFPRENWQVDGLAEMHWGCDLCVGSIKSAHLQGKPWRQIAGRMPCRLVAPLNDKLLNADASYMVRLRTLAWIVRL